MMPAVGHGLYKTAPEITREAVALALDAGVRHFDTASSYGNEAELGAALKAWRGGERNELFVTTKLSNQGIAFKSSSILPIHDE